MCSAEGDCSSLYIWNRYIMFHVINLWNNKYKCVLKESVLNRHWSKCNLINYTFQIITVFFIWDNLKQLVCFKKMEGLTQYIIYIESASNISCDWLLTFFTGWSKFFFSLCPGAMHVLSSQISLKVHVPNCLRHQQTLTDTS